MSLKMSEQARIGLLSVSRENMPRWTLDTRNQGLKEALRKLYEHMRRVKRQRDVTRGGGVGDLQDRLANF